MIYIAIVIEFDWAFVLRLDWWIGHLLFRRGLNLELSME